MREMSPELEMMMRIFDRLGEVIQATVASSGGKPPKIKPLPRPVTALERLRSQQTVTKHYSVADRMLGRNTGDSAHRARSAPPPRAARHPPRPPSAGVLLKRADPPA